MLAIGYGNPGRLDDGIGPALADLLAVPRLPGLTVDADYQLTVEDAAAIAEHDAVVFMDATVEGPEPFSFRRLPPETETRLGFTSHDLEPQALLALARDLFDARAEGYVLAVRGYEFDGFGETLSPGAQANVSAALTFLTAALRAGRLAEAANAAQPAS